MRVRPFRTLLLFTCAASASAQEVYLDKISAAPGETVQVYVSTSAATHEVTLSRSFYFGDEELRASSGVLPGGLQSAVAGSFAAVDDNGTLDITGDISLEAWVRPISISASAFAGILLKYKNPGETAYGIYLMPGGQVSFYLGETGVFDTENRLLTTAALSLDVWTHVVATYDGQTKRIYLDGALDVSAPRSGAIFDTSEPLRVGSFGSAGNTLEGDIDSAAVYSRALTASEIQARFVQRANAPAVLSGCVAQYDFEELVGSSLEDASGTGNGLTLFNHGTRGIPGPLPAGSTGKPGNWAVRFSSADKYNPAWIPTFAFVVSPAWDSGFYALEVRTPSDSIKVPFIVKPLGSQRARIAVLANTNTWAAYNGWSQSLYSMNPGGSINRYVGLLQPSPNARLGIHTPRRTFSPRVDAERYLYTWLDHNGYEFDLYTDLDLHKDPSLLAGYDTLMISGHSEYWTAEEIDHVEAFLDAGGSLVNLSGNTMWSRVTFNATFTVMEGRKHPWGVVPNVLPPAERWHSQAGQVLGGTWRCIGRPEHAVLGTGYGIQTFGSGVFGAYEVLDPGHWVFAGTGVQAGDFIGQDALNGNAILGHEFDVVHPLWSPAGIEILARGADLNASSLDISDCEVRVSTSVSVGGEMVYFDHPGGGGVFGAPTVAFGGGLLIDPALSQLLRNVLDRFRKRRGPRYRPAPSPLRRH